MSVQLKRAQPSVHANFSQRPQYQPTRATSHQGGSGSHQLLGPPSRALGSCGTRLSSIHASMQLRLTLQPKLDTMQK
eukprot:5646078-Amphidinium_carterae.1